MKIAHKKLWKLLIDIGKCKTLECDLPDIIMELIEEDNKQWKH